jgi:hypothetical protein
LEPIKNEPEFLGRAGSIAYGYFAWVNCPLVTQFTTSSESGFDGRLEKPNQVPFSSIMYSGVPCHF